MQAVIAELGRSGERAVQKTPSETNGGTRVDSMGRTLPEIYATMLAPHPAPESLTIPEMYERFASDSRDESWAYPMELGINQYVEQRGSAFGVDFEFVECASRCFARRFFWPVEWKGATKRGNVIAAWQPSEI